MPEATPLDPSLDPYTQLEMRQRALADRRSQLLQKMAQDAKVRMPETTMVGNRLVSPHWSQYLNATLAQTGFLNQLADTALRRDEGAYSADEARAASELLGRLNGSPTPAPTNDVTAPNNTVTVPPTDAQRLQLLQEGRKLPSLRDTLTAALNDQLIQAPVRTEARQQAKDLQQERLQERQDAQQAALAAQKERQQAQLDAQRQLEEGRRQTQLQIASMNNETRRAVSSMAAALRQGQGQGQTDQVLERQKAMYDLKQQALQSAQARQAQEALATAAEAEGLLKSGAPSGSAPGAWLTKGANALGISTDASKANAQLQVLSGKLTALVPRYSGQVSNYELQQYKQMAGDIGNPSLPLPTRLAALQQVKMLHARALNASVGQTADTSTPAPTPGHATAPAPKVVDYSSLK